MWLSGREVGGRKEKRTQGEFWGAAQGPTFLDFLCREAPRWGEGRRRENK